MYQNLNTTTQALWLSCHNYIVWCTRDILYVYQCHSLFAVPSPPAVSKGSSHARKAARRLKREQKERQRQERYAPEFRLERKKLDHHAEHSHPSPSHHLGREAGDWRTCATVLVANIGQRRRAPWSLNLTSFLRVAEGILLHDPLGKLWVGVGLEAMFSSSRRTKSSYERHSHRTRSPPVRDSTEPSSRQPNEHSTSPFDTLESLEAQTMSDSASKFSDFSAEPDYSAPPLKSAPPVGVHPHMS